MTIDLTEEDQRRLTEISEAYGMSPTEIIRHHIEIRYYSLLSQRIVAKNTADQRTLPLFPGAPR